MHLSILISRPNRYLQNQARYLNFKSHMSWIEESFANKRLIHHRHLLEALLVWVRAVTTSMGLDHRTIMANIGLVEDSAVPTTNPSPNPQDGMATKIAVIPNSTLPEPLHLRQMVPHWPLIVNLHGHKDPIIYHPGRLLQ